MTDLSDQIIAEITTKNVHPKSKAVIAIQRAAIWSVFLFSLFALSIIIGLVVYYIFDNDWELNSNFLNTVPVLFIGVGAVLFILAIIEFRSTDNGYKLNNATLFVAGLGIAAFFGFTVYAVGLAENTDRLFYNGIEFYSNYIKEKAQLLSNPDEGYLTGKILNVKENFTANLVDVQSQLWEIMFTPHTVYELNLNATDVFFVKIFGERIGERIFVAEHVKPFTSKQFINYLQLNNF